MEDDAPFEDTWYKKQSGTCTRGHVYAKSGRTPGGQCRECFNAYQRYRYWERHQETNLTPNDTCRHGHRVRDVGQTGRGICRACYQNYHQQQQATKTKRQRPKRRKPVNTLSTLLIAATRKGIEDESDP